jgi:hypothetical protein
MRGRLILMLVCVALAFGCGLLRDVSPEPKASGTNGVLALTVNVKGAEVFVDEALFGQIKKAEKEQDFIVTGGKHELVVKKFGFEDYKATIGVEAGGVNTLTVELARTPVADVSKEMPKSEGK